MAFDTGRSRIVRHRIGASRNNIDKTLSEIILFLSPLCGARAELIGTGMAVLQKRKRLGGLLNYYYREVAWSELLV